MVLVDTTERYWCKNHRKQRLNKTSQLVNLEGSKNYIQNNVHDKYKTYFLNKVCIMSYVSLYSQMNKGIAILIRLNRSLNLQINNPTPTQPQPPTQGITFFLAIFCPNRFVCDFIVPRDLDLEQFWS